MKFLVEKKDLLNLLGKTLNIVEKKTSMPILMNVLLEASEGVLKVFATDLEVSIMDSLRCEVSQSGKMVVSAKSLFEVAKELEESTITITKQENNWIEIKQGKYRSKLVGLNADEYPAFPTYLTDHFVTVEADDFKEMIDKTIFSVSVDETRYYLNGVYFEPTGSDSYTMVGTDGHRLSLIKKKVTAKKSFSVEQGVIIPRKGLYEVRKLMESTGGEFKVAIEGAQFIVKNETTTLLIRLIEGKYLNYNQFIPKELKEKLIIHRETLMTSIRRVALFANQKSKSITLNLSKNKMEITSNSPDLGDAREEIEVDYQGAEFKISFNSKYILDVLNVMTDEKVDLELNDHLSPGILKPHNEPNYTCVVMPMRI